MTTILRLAVSMCFALAAGTGTVEANGQTNPAAPGHVSVPLLTPRPVAARLAKLSTVPASERRVPPGRACPPNTAGCLKTPGATTYGSFLDWVARSVDRMWAQQAARVYARWASPRYFTLSGARTAKTRCTTGSTFATVTALTGPFWCPDDRGGTIFLTMDWLKQEAFPRGTYKSKDFALAYVVAHEWAHHAQYRFLFAGEDTFANRLRSIHVELMADCLAGIWARSIYHQSLLEPGDFKEAVALARKLRDDPRTNPASEGAHGSAAQRSYWLRRGFATGSGKKCATWESRTLPSLLPA